MKYFIKNLSEYKINELSEKKWFNAAELGDLRLIRIYLDNGFDINYQDENKYSALSIACENLNVGLVKLLLSYPEINVNILDDGNTTELIRACYFNRLDIAKELLKHPNIKVNIKDLDYHTALFYAKNKGYHELEDLLIKAGAK